MDIVIGKHTILHLDYFPTYYEIQSFVTQKLGLDKNEFYLVYNGKLLANFKEHACSGRVLVVLRTFGGKGGFGSNLRSMGHQISKTNNKDSCRDLTGRRLRNINEEQRIKTWCEQQTDRAKEIKNKKQKKLEKMCEVPKFEFNDQQYELERSNLSEKIEDAVIKGIEVSHKRKSEDKADNIVKKKRKLWGDELDDLDSSDVSDDENANV